ncbi:prepilin peptidase [Corynebacterium sp. 3HC-13]|uniref:prepilin peptidase n=1 Tax=Corynebacterium poyangense TaxID=2684405 RepID=UPI001CC91253|nr:A24 family peptidase [Corynebacterium poyangense]MBZ8177873.1 prepilin peptidase [Corynebacterium poyangense]
MNVVLGAVAGVGVLLWGWRLIWWDLKCQRLPNHLTVPAAAIMTLGVIFSHHPHWIIGGLAWSGVYFLGAVWSRGGLGGGDVKLAFSLGIIASMGGVLGVILAMLFSNAISVFSLIKQHRRAQPHGPAMIAGTILGLVIGGTITTW